jgi:hypothetical protein
MGTGGSFLGGKARPGRDADHSPPSSAPFLSTGVLLDSVTCFYLCILQVVYSNEFLSLTCLLYASQSHVLITKRFGIDFQCCMGKYINVNRFKILAYAGIINQSSYLEASSTLSWSG